MVSMVHSRLRAVTALAWPGPSMLSLPRFDFRLAQQAAAACGLSQPAGDCAMIKMQFDAGSHAACVYRSGRPTCCPSTGARCEGAFSLLTGQTARQNGPALLLWSSLPVRVLAQPAGTGKRRLEHSLLFVCS